MSRITVLYFPDEITTLYSLSPLVLSKFRRLFRFLKDPDAALESGDSSIVFVRLNKWRGIADVDSLLRRAKETFRRVIVFDDTADPRELNNDWLRLADIYFKKQLLSDLSLYYQEAYGKRYFTDYYHHKYGIDDAKVEQLPPVDPEDIAKLRLSWNLGIGPYPRLRTRKAIGMRLERFLGLRATRLLQYRKLPSLPDAEHREPVVSARFGSNFSRETVAYHRRIFLDAAESDPRCRTGRVSLEDYNRELRNAAMTLSPFGWGEVCFRDFEAVAAGSVLLKPSMNHVTTWPDIYQAHKTYAPLRWDASDMSETVDKLLADESPRRELATAALDVMSDAYRSLDLRVEAFVEQCQAT